MKNKVFRVWDRTAKKYTNSFSLSPEGHLIDPSGSMGMPKTGVDYGNFYEVEFSTTRKDVEGNYIFQNDIVKDGEGDILYVKWDKSRAAFVLIHPKWNSVYYDFSVIDDGRELRVIGNLAQDKTLLKRVEEDEELKHFYNGGER